MFARFWLGKATWCLYQGSSRNLLSINWFFQLLRYQEHATWAATPSPDTPAARSKLNPKCISLLGFFFASTQSERRRIDHVRRAHCSSGRDLVSTLLVCARKRNFAEFAAMPYVRFWHKADVRLPEPPLLLVTDRFAPAQAAE